jgi:hypothetical protein
MTSRSWKSLFLMSRSEIDKAPGWEYERGGLKIRMKTTRIVSTARFPSMMSFRSWFQTSTPGRHKRIGIFSPSIFRVDSIMRSAVDQFEIFFSIIRLVAVEMMDVFKTLKFPAKKSFHDQSMFINITAINSDQNISIDRYHAAAFPGSDFLTRLGYTGAFFRTKFGRLQSISINEKIFSANFTNLFYHGFNIYHSGIENQGEKR